MVDVADADVVAVLTRAPSSGGKSRLFAALGRPVDETLLAALLLDTIDGVATAPARIVCAVTPASGRGEVAQLTAALPKAVDVIGQPDGDLGRRMARTMSMLFAAGARRVALVGSDLPSISAAPICEAFYVLAADPEAVVLGPARDGGYYLVAATCVPPVFDGIEWGSARVLAQTRAAADRAGVRVHCTAPLHDVDSVEDLQMLAGGSTRTGGWARANGIARMRGSET